MCSGDSISSGVQDVLGYADPTGLIGGPGGLFSGPPDKINVSAPQWDPQIFNSWYNKQANLYTDQQKTLQQLLNKQRTNAMTNLTTGTEGNDFRNYYNNLGLLNSGAFNEGLANKFSNIEQGTEQQLGQLGIKQADMLAGMNLSGMQRQFGLQDTAANMALQQAMANAGLMSQYRGQNLGLFGDILGAGGNAASGYFMGG